MSGGSFTSLVKLDYKIHHQTQRSLFYYLSNKLVHDFKLLKDNYAILCQHIANAGFRLNVFVTVVNNTYANGMG